MRGRRIEDLYPLSPLQKGLLFHSLYAPEAGDYWQQVSGTLSGALDVEAFARAWQAVIDRHPVLRTASEGKARDEQWQVVGGGVDLPLARADWRGSSPQEQERLLEGLLAQERAQGSDLQSPPLMRLALVRTGD